MFKMASTWMAHLYLYKLILLVTLCQLTACQLWDSCTFPKYMTGDWFSMEDGKSIGTLINERKWGEYECKQMYNHFKPVNGTQGANHTILLSNSAGSSSTCFYCLDVLWRTSNVIQMRKGSCLSSSSGTVINVETSCGGVRKLPSVDEVITMFRTTDALGADCISTFEGVYQFTYEVDFGGGGICDNQDSQIRACQDPGSAYLDNQVFRLTYAKCRDVNSSGYKQIRYQCYGTWFAVRGSVGYTFAAISDTVEKDRRERFKCLMTNKNQKDAQNKIRWVMSRFADCKKLLSIRNGPVRLVLSRIPPVYLSPKCSLPRNISGFWETQGIEYRSTIRTNETHIYFHTPINEFEYQETYYSCQQSQGSRFLMTKVVVGRCEVDFTCFDIVPRHHSIVKFRVGKPYQYQTRLQKTDPKGFMKSTFREACSWTAFTFDRDEYKWKYETMIQSPPSAVPCPIAGRYSFIQQARTELEKYQTRIRGVTEKPRLKVACRNWVTEFKSCSNTMTKIAVDAEYCESVDYRGRPIGEYDEADNILTCVGFWMEDMKSYLITYDEEDAVSSLRCWVYERKSWTGVYMSRAQNARCPSTQNAQSYQIDGTGLSMDLTESERLFDDCPQRFDPGADPYSKPTTLWVLSGAGNHVPSVVIVIVSIVTAIYTIWR